MVKVPVCVSMQARCVGAEDALHSLHTHQTFHSFVTKFYFFICKWVLSVAIWLMLLLCSVIYVSTCYWSENVVMSCVIWWHEVCLIFFTT